MTGEPYIARRVAYGAILLALYGAWTACFRMAGDLALGTRLAALAWAVALFAAVGAAAGGGTAVLVSLISAQVPAKSRASVAAGIETALVAPAFLWLLLNELLYWQTSEVLGIGALAMLWHDTAAVLQNAWRMAARYLVLAAVLTVLVIALVHRRALRSHRTMESRGQTDPPPYRSSPRRRIGLLAAAVLVIAVMLAWQFRARPSLGLVELARSSPPLRVIGLARALVGIDLDRPAPARFGSPVITEQQYQASMGKPHDPAPNIIYILMESTSAKALHCYGYPREDITPNIDALAAGGVLFEHCVAGASFSSCGLTSITTSLYMLRGRRFDYFGNEFPFMGLPRALKLAGYQLNMFSSGNESFDHINRFSPPSDFDLYFSHDTCGLAQADCMRMDDRIAVGRFEEWLAARRDPRPFYAGFYLQSPHFNYEVPEPWFSHYQPVPPLYSNGDGILHIPAEIVPQLRNQYDNAMRYADYWVGRIRDALAKAGQLDRSIIMITGDHGEAFMQHGLARHGTHTWEEMIHIPLIVYAGSDIRPRLPATIPARVPHTVSGIDIAPTVAALVGFAPHPSWQGVNILDPAYTDRDRPIFSMTQYTRWQEVACVNKIKYTYDLTDVREYLFDLKVDPDETHNLVDERPDLLSAMRDLLAGWHTHQLAYYESSARPFTCYIGRYEPDSTLLARLGKAQAAGEGTGAADRITPLGG
ncbi:MAG TPA: sulfatase-like hydrolase/transferase [Phycisphaerae bacterium]|nr:sulfatase-like hydrolase/transferase [Phycisphaerae bacterium]HRY67119.1 sulfatase-like hydrolase/transferase [Phycisphaerae bacterium]